MAALLTSVGEGTVTLYCRRVVRAIREFGLSCVGWPSEERKEAIKAGFKEICGLDGIIGALDGSLIDFARRPPGSDASFISRKGTIAVSKQVNQRCRHTYILYRLIFRRLWTTKADSSRLRLDMLVQRMTRTCGSTHMFISIVIHISRRENSY
jgi:hypothetical protein